MKFCKKCGSEIEDNTVFCPNCGENITLINGVSQEKTSENLLELSETVNENAEELCEEDDFDEEKEIAKFIAASKRKTVLRKTILVFAIILIGGLLGVVSNLDSFVSDYSEPSNNSSNNGAGSSTVQYGDTSGTVNVSYCMIDLQTYYTLSQLNRLDFKNISYIEIGDMSWENTYTTVSSLVGWYGKKLASKQQVNPQTIKLFNAIAYGASAANDYQLVALYVNGKAATLDTYLYDGDKIQAVVVYS